MINIDETGHPENGKKLWTWGFHVPGSRGFTWFHIDPSRSTEVLYGFLGETFPGVIGCDYYSVYRKFLDETDAVMQFCWAHLIRDVKFLTTLSDPVTRRPRPEAVDQDQVPVPHLAPPRADAQGEMGACGTTGREGGAEAGTACALAERGPEHRPAVPRLSDQLLHLPQAAGCRAHQQQHGTADAVCGDRPQDHAGHAERTRSPLVRADLDRAGHVRATRPLGVPLPLPVHRGPFL